MGLDDPKLLSGYVSFDGQACAICVLFFKGEQVLLLGNSYCHSKDINQVMVGLLYLV